MTAIVTSRDVEEIVSKLSSDKAKSREVFFSSLSSLCFFPIRLVAENNETKMDLITIYIHTYILTLYHKLQKKKKIEIGQIS